ncbi:glutamine synthetase family protein [Roseicitreum antarcticum]|uniref:Glutamine synthetase n=1 Tax=Roseicitreum antarcticum TaxID=564137 RepID=A0A1H2UM50_9RHOB|nr:glutamine synthetase family protein [Roseicitreum antarcticum]SDW57048.1 glutamine synthetase [Roseicitreum antarcticum]
MPGNLTHDSLKAAVASGSIDTVLACGVDMQGRLMGKRFHAQHFVDSAWRETHCCNYLLATDLEMHTVPGYASSSWQAGYGDYVMQPDMTTLRHIPWLEGTALVLCDILDHHTHAEVPHSPRAILKRQVARLEAMGLRAMMATELEFFLFRESYDALRDSNFAGLTPISGYNEDYHIFQTTKEEDVMRAIRNGLYGAGIPVENSKGEAEAGQEEINVRYSDALDTADNHSVVKNGCKEIAWSKGRAVTFMAKWHHDRVGSSSHVHMSLLHADGASAFHDPDAPDTMSALMRQFTAGQLAHTAEICYFLAPYVNSYKRFQSGTFAPTSTVWSTDNRTAGYRLCGAGTKAVRMECRIGGADLNPYLAMAALIAAGIAGIEGQMELPPAFAGDAYAGDAPALPRTLRDAADTLEGSAMLRAAFGDAVIDHYTHAARWEVSQADRVVTDWEVQRGFERC